LVELDVTVKLREYVQRRELTFPAFLLQWFVSALATVKPQGREHTVCVRRLRDPIANR
jgi:hypothetical protein